MRLFHAFQMRNALGETRDLCDIFRETPQAIPPAGAGECAAPKLLQYAYLNGFEPLAISSRSPWPSFGGETLRKANCDAMGISIPPAGGNACLS